SQDPQLVDSPSNGWTDEKHALFLNSIEASFVNELYNEEYHSRAFLGQLSRIKTHKGSCGPYKNDLKSGQVFKVLQTGCQESFRFDGDKNHAGMKNGSLPLSANPWIQHFRSPPFMKEWQFKSSDRVDDVEFIKSSFQLANERCDSEATSSKNICHQDWVGSSIGTCLVYLVCNSFLYEPFPSLFVIKLISFWILVPYKAEFCVCFALTILMIVGVNE
ncbi:hypothetical protein BHE74_00011504, partial [Ensete ventricosum]